MLMNIFVDCGIKNSQLRALLKYNVQLTIVNTDYSLIVDEVLNKEYDGIFISNGPGDPTTSTNIVNQLKSLFSLEKLNLPIFGICYGHQLIGLASGCTINKMRYGNRGHNIPCNLIGTNKCYITSQNHGYEVKLNENIDSNGKNYL